MKKIYYSPEVELVEYDIDTVMQSISIPAEGDGETEEGDANTNRNDWNNIWGEM